MDKKKLERLEQAFRNIKKSDELGAQPEPEGANRIGPGVPETTGGPEKIL
jgi:hypothetical protein